MDPVRVLVVEDHPVTRDGVRAALERDGRAVVVAEAVDVRSACSAADRARPEVAVVDLRLGGRECGEDVIRHLRRHLPAVRVLVLSQADPEDVVAAIRAGAHGYVSKAATSDELARAVRTVRTGPVLPAELAAHLIGELRHEARPLTGREREVLHCVAKGYGNREIADELGIAVRTVNRHLENIRDKLRARRRSQLIRIARGG
ncbi:response regulator [Saccharothrix obliqua]|uniref:response regulator n=1 Tax=Saccharothrix obliqua TaxID=2861747 RepID=UPI001C5F7F32|nr:response regulator transcription factor [Saccharothrix obliqua]MBW4718115.1 response regulator transcription factor [Saccharothrix obliqua]